MNKTARSVAPQVAALPAEEQTDARAELFLVWSQAREAEDWVDAAESCGRDRGLWLLRNAMRRQQGWLRLGAESERAGNLELGRNLKHGYGAAKRGFDMAVSAVLLAALAPLFALVAALIRLDSPGPAFFRQRRVGQDGEEFLLWKFRSMHADAAQYAPSPTSADDVRLTRVGRAIRRMSVDELPQLINVLRGEMSLVGPRPEMPFIVAGYSPLERRRLAVKPGITGLWQVSPARAFPIHENLQYDLHYIRNRNLVLDGMILLRTAVAVIRGVGAV